MLNKLAAVLIGLSLLISLYHLAYLNKVYPFVKIGRVEVSNLTLKQAGAKINQSLPPATTEINLTFGNQSWPVALADLGISYDSVSSAGKAYVRGRSDNFFKDLALQWNQWRRPQELSLVFNLNPDKFEAVIDTAKLGINEEPINPVLLLNQKGSVDLIPGKNGRVVDQALLEQQLKDRLGRLDFSPLEIPIKLVTVDVSADQLANAQAAAENMENSKLSLRAENFSRDLSGQKLLDLISFSGGFDEEKIASLTAQISLGVDRPPQNASFKFDGKKVVEFAPALNGLTLDQPATNQLILNSLNAIAQSPGSQTIDLIVDLNPPNNSIGEVNDLGIKELLGKGESTFRGSIAGRKHNIALAASRVSGILVAPGDTFSFNQVVGDISKETGYEQAFIIQNGRTILGDGGGVCQVSTTLFRAALNAGLDILERHAHSYRVGYYEQNAPAGLDATVFAPSVDFKFKNDTQNHLLIQATTDLANNYLKFEIYGASDGRKATITNTRLWDQSPAPEPLYQDDPTLPTGQTKQVDWAAPGGKASFDWQVARNGEVIQKKTFYSSYQPWQAVYLRGTLGI